MRDPHYKVDGGRFDHNLPHIKFYFAKPQASGWADGQRDGMGEREKWDEIEANTFATNSRTAGG